MLAVDCLKDCYYYCYYCERVTHMCLVFVYEVEKPFRITFVCVWNILYVLLISPDFQHMCPVLRVNRIFIYSLNERILRFRFLRRNMSYSYNCFIFYVNKSRQVIINNAFTSVLSPAQIIHRFKCLIQSIQKCFRKL